MSTIPNPYAPPRATVRDISMPDESLVYADRVTRLGAAILDGIIVFAMVYLPMIIFAVVGAIVGGPAGARLEGTDALGSLLAIAAFGSGTIGFVIWAVMTYKRVEANGQTIAKKMLNIKVVRSDGSPVSMGRIFWLRNVVNAALGIIPLYGIVDVLFIFGEAQQCLHDKLADTIVVKA